jgi:gliding motility-associated-like protein
MSIYRSLLPVFSQKRFKTIVTTALVTGLMCLFNQKIQAQCTPIANAIPSITLTYVQGGGTNASGVAYNPNFNIYYAGIAGNSGFPLETFDNVGNPLYQTNTGFDMRGLWWNFNLNQLESNGYNTFGVWSYDMNASGYALNTGTQVFTGNNQPNAQSCGDYDCVNDEIIYYNSGVIMRRDRATNALIANLAITGLPVGTGSINSYTIVYTDCLGHEYGILDYVNKRIYFIDKATGAYTAMSQLPVGTVTNSGFRLSWANEMVWLYNVADRTWYSFQVLTGFAGTCTVVACTPPTIIIDDITICAPSTADLNNAINAASTPGTTSFHATLADATAGINPISNTVAVSGTYYVRIEDAGDPTCFSTAAINVTINPDYSSIEAVTACENSSVTYPDGTSATITASTSYVSNLLTVAGCDSIITTNVTMDPVYAIVEAVTACENSSVTYPDGTTATITASTSYVSNLTTAAGCDSIITTNVTMGLIYNLAEAVTVCENTSVTYPDGSSATITANTTYTSNLLTTAGCDSIIITTVTMDPLPISGTNSSIAFCSSDPASDLFAQLGGSPDLGGAWSPALTSGTGLFDPSVDLAGTYTYTVTNPCGSVGSDIVVTMPVDPDPGNNGLVTFCSNDPTYDLFTALGGTPDIGGTWSPALVSGTGLFNPSVDLGGIYTYTMTTACGAFTSQVDVTLNPAGDATFSYPVTTYCLNNSNPIPTITGTPGGTFTITGAGVINSSTGEIDIIGCGIGGFGVTYTTSGPCPDAFVYDITILDISDATITPVGPFCSNDGLIQLQAVDPGGTWSGTGVDPVTGMFDPSTASSGTNDITYTIPGACGDVSTIQIDVTQAPSVGTISNISIDFGDSILLNSSSTINNYSWSPSTWLDCDDCQAPMASPQETTTYTVTVDTNGCSATASVTITIIFPPIVFVPNIFSPNGDDNNDILFVRGSGIRELTFIVYDRWGEKVFESTSLENGWDGTFRGKEMNPAVFMYMLDVSFENGSTIIKKGDVTLIR